MGIKNAFMDEEILERLQKEFKVGRKTAIALSAGLDEAYYQYERMKGVLYNDMPIKQYRESIEAAYSAIRKFNISIKNIPESERSKLDAYYMDANNGDTLLHNLSFDSLDSISRIHAVSGMEIIAEKLEKAFAGAEDFIPASGQGGQNNQAKQYVFAVETLAQYFSEECPNYALSKSKNTMFYRYVQLWFEAFIDPNNPDRDVSRVLKHAFDNSQIKIKHDKG